MKKSFLTLLFLGICINSFAGAPVRDNSYTSGTTISSTNVMANENAIFTYLQNGVDTYKSASIVADALASAAVTDAKIYGITTLGKVNTSALTTTTGAIGMILMNDGNSWEGKVIGSAETFPIAKSTGIEWGYKLTASSSRPALVLYGDNTGSQETLSLYGNGTTSLGIYQYANSNGIQITKSGTGSGNPISITNSGTGDTIIDDSGAKLTAAGVWTDASSCHKDKEDVKENTPVGYTNKLKNLKLFEYRKKYEKSIKPNSRLYTGYILDDPSTPEELISRDLVTNEINGVSAALGVNFLLAVNKELIARIESLETRIEALENP